MEYVAILSYPTSIQEWAFSDVNLLAIGANTLLIDNFDTWPQMYYIFIYARPPIKPLQVSIHLGYIWMNRILQIMGLYQYLLNYTIHSKNTNHFSKSEHTTCIKCRTL